MFKKTNSNYKVKALNRLQEIASSSDHAMAVVNELISDWKKVAYHFNYSGAPVIKKEDVASEDFSSFVQKVSSSYKSFLDSKNADKLSEELFGYKIPMDKTNKMVADLGSFNRALTQLFRYKSHAFYLDGVGKNSYTKIHQTFAAPESEEKSMVNALIQIARRNNLEEDREKLEQLMYYRKNKSYRFSINVYYDLINQKIKALFTSIIRNDSQLYHESEKLLTFKVETLPNGKVSPFLKAILTEDEKKIKKFMADQLQKSASSLYSKLSTRFLDLNSTTVHEFEEAVRKVDFSEIKSLFANLAEQDKQTAKSILIELALKE